MTSLGARTKHLLQIQGEGLISAGRAILSLFFLLQALWHPSSTSAIVLWGYAGYTLTLLGLKQWSHIEPARLGLWARLIDILVFGPALFMAEGVEAPSLVYLIFLLLCCALRLQFTSYALVVVLALLLDSALKGMQYLQLVDSPIMMAATVLVVGVFVGCRWFQEQSVLKVLSQLAEWSSATCETLEAVCCDMLPHAANILGSRRLVLLLEEEDEPWTNVVSWSKEGCHYSCEKLSDIATLVAGPAEVQTFFCKDAGNPRGMLLECRGKVFRRSHGAPIAPALREKCAIGAVLGSRLESNGVRGYLLVLDKRFATSRDLVLCEIVASEVTRRLEHYFTERDLQEAAALHERASLARDLHDGLLQSMSGTVLDLERAYRLMETDPRAVRALMRNIQRHLALEQKDLRSQVTRLRFLHRPPEEFDFRARLEDLEERIARQWNIRVSIEAPATLPPGAKGMARDIYLMIHEALMNAVRHAGASSLCLQLRFDAEQAYIKVSDNGRGFSFPGKCDGGALRKLEQGPVSLSERIADLRGCLTVHSGDTGAVLEIFLPCHEQKGCCTALPQ